MLRKIQFAFTGFILSFKTSLITNRIVFTGELITDARGGLIFGETYNSMYRKIGQTRQDKTMFYLESYTVLCISTLSK